MPNPKLDACRNVTLSQVLSSDYGDLANVIASGAGFDFSASVADRASKALQFVNVGIRVMCGQRCVATATSKTMAKRIARALNAHQPNSEGV